MQTVQCSHKRRATSLQTERLYVGLIHRIINKKPSCR